MYDCRKQVCTIIIMILTLSVLVASNQSPKSVVEEPAKFVIASWDFPDEYGQGIYGFFIKENSTGSFLNIRESIFLSTEEMIIEVNASIAIKLDVRVQVNYTLLGLTHPDDIELGINYFRLNVTVTSAGQTVFSQQNFTYDDLSGFVETDIWYFSEEVILNFITVAGMIYTVVVDYEIYHEAIEEEYLHDCSSVSGITYDSNTNLGVNDYGIGSDGSSVEYWILPDDGSAEGVTYKLDFANIANPDDNINITVRYKVEGATNFFYYRLEYDDASGDYSDYGTSTSWATLNMTLDAGKTLDYMYIYNYDDPSATASGNLSVWIDYIEVYSFDTDWHEISEVEVLFSVLYDTWGMDTALIILGLVMIPTSTIYLAYGAKHDRSSDRLFYGLILFFLGCGLFIGGIMP